MIENQDNIEIPRALRFLFTPARYKVAYGGRGGGKSWGFARVLLIKCLESPIRVLCAREIQKSIKMSVHQLLADQIDILGLSDFFRVLETEIQSTNGSRIYFTGLQEHTISSLKSFEGVNICWVEEAHTVSKKSWITLLPTIRAEGSEIWISFNPNFDADETYIRWVLYPPANAVVKKITYKDNPWFSSVLEQERIFCEANDPENYPIIWLGECRSAVEGAIYAREVAHMIQEQRVSFLPYDPLLKVHTVWDMGWNDAMAIIFVQVVRSECRIIDYIEDNRKTLDYYVNELKNRSYNYAYDYLPHDAGYSDYKSGLSAVEILKRLGRKPRITPNLGVETGIRAARMLFPRVVMEKDKCAKLLDGLKRYRRSVNRTTGEEGAPIHDASSHAADAFRYLAVNIRSMSNEDDDEGNVLLFRPRKPAVPGMGY